MGNLHDIQTELIGLAHFLKLNDRIPFGREVKGHEMSAEGFFEVSVMRDMKENRGPMILLQCTFPCIRFMDQFCGWFFCGWFFCGWLVLFIGHGTIEFGSCL
jgi:hypothetical protein